MRAIDIMEGRDSPLYHWMGSKKAENVLTNDVMPAKWWHSIPQIGKVFGNSFSRNKNFKFGVENFVRIVVSQELLSQTNKIIPLDADRVYFKSLGYTDDRASDRIDNKKNQFSEEFVVGDIKNLHRYIVKIEILKRYSLIRDAEFILELAEKYCEKYNIELYVDPKVIDDVNNFRETRRSWHEDDI